LSKCFFIFFIFIFSVSYGASFEIVDIKGVVDTLKDFDSELISDDYENMIESIREGEFEFDYKKFLGNLGNFLVKEVRNNIGILVQIVIIALLMGLLHNLESAFSKDGVSQIAFYVCYILMITLLISGFTNIYNIAKDSILEITKFMNVLIPIVVGLVVASGGVTVSTIIYPLLTFATQFISGFIAKFLLPVSMICFALNIVSNVSKKVSVSRIIKFLESASMWALGIILTIFVGTLSLEGTIASTVDGVTVKTAKFLFSGSIPVVGKLLGDSVDTILGSTLIMKDAIGFVGVVILLSLALVPIIKIFTVVVLYHITGVVIEPFADERLCKCLSNTAKNGGIILGMVITVIIMFIIGTVMLLKITNFAAMHG